MLLKEDGGLELFECYKRCDLVVWWEVYLLRIDMEEGFKICLFLFFYIDREMELRLIVSFVRSYIYNVIV